MTIDAETMLIGPGHIGVANRDSFHQAAVEIIESRGEAGGTLVIDLSATEFVDTAGLGTMALIHQKAADAGLDVRLLNPNEDVRVSLELARLEALFETGDSDA